MKRLFLSLALALGIFAIPLPSFATVSSTTNTVQYSGDGYSTSFSFNNNVYLASDLNVYEVTAGVSTLLTLNTNYSVSLTAISGVTGAYTATINLAGGSSPAGALAVGTTLVIVRNIPYTQLINISDYSATPAATWNQAHDRGVILSQQLLNLVNRSILQSVTATTPIVFPPSSPGLLLGWNNSGLLDNIANTSNPWLYSGSNIYYNNGNVGIGTSSPDSPLYVSSSSNNDLNVVSTNGYAALLLNASTGNNGYILGQVNGVETGRITFSYDNTIAFGNGTNNLLSIDNSYSDVYTNAWADYSGSSTIVGWTSISAKQIYTKKIGKTVYVSFYITGTSNSTAVTFTLPYTATTTTTSPSTLFYGVNNGTSAVSFLSIPNANATATLYYGVANGGAAWTNSGTKTVSGQFFYQSA